MNQNQAIFCRCYLPFILLVLFLFAHSCNSRKYSSETSLESLKDASTPIDSCKIYIKLGKAFLEDLQVDTAYVIFNKAYDISERLAHPQLSVDAQLEISKCSFRKRDYKGFKTQSEEAKRIAENAGYKSGQVIAEKNIALYLMFIEGNPDTAVNILKPHISFWKGNKGFKELADTYNLLGGSYQRLGNFENALLNYLYGLEIAEKTDEITTIQKLTNNIGILIRNQGEPKEALGYFEKSLSIAEKAGNDVEIAKLYNNLGLTELNLANFEKSFNYFQKALTLKREIGNNRQIASTLSNICQLYSMQNKFNKAEPYCIEAYKLQRDKDLRGQVITATILSPILTQKMDLDSALNLLIEAEDICRKRKDSTNLRTVLNHLSDVYAQKKDYKNAYEYKVKHFTLYDGHLVTQLIPMRRIEIDQIKKIKDEQIAVEKKEKWLIGLIGFGVFVILGFVIYIMRRVLKISRTNERLLNEKMKRVAEQNHLLLDDIKTLKEEQKTPLYYSQLRLSLENRNKDILLLGEIIFVTIHRKMLGFKTKDGFIWMDGTIAKFYTEVMSHYPIFVQIHRSYIINTLHVRQGKASSVTMSDTEKINVSDTFKPKLEEALLWLKGFDKPS